MKPGASSGKRGKEAVCATHSRLREPGRAEPSAVARLRRVERLRECVCVRQRRWGKERIECCSSRAAGAAEAATTTKADERQETNG